jgi:hypothetical protein
MEYNRIVAVTGLPGLYEVISSKSDGAVVRSLEDQSTKFVSSRIHNLSHLESIEVYTVRENVSLADVFNAMKENKDLPDVKDNKAVKSYFEKAYPDMDFDRVYTSDMKKMIKWFEVLEQNNVDYNAKPEAEEEQPVEETVTEVAAEEPTAKKTKAKSKATESAEAQEETGTEEKPKKTAKKKKTEE